MNHVYVHAGVSRSDDHSSDHNGRHDGHLRRSRHLHSSRHLRGSRRNGRGQGGNHHHPIRNPTHHGRHGNDRGEHDEAFGARLGGPLRDHCDSHLDSD